MFLSALKVWKMYAIPAGQPGEKKLYSVKVEFGRVEYLLRGKEGRHGARDADREALPNPE